MLRTIVEGEPDFEPQLKALVARSAALPESIESGARATVADVRRRGDEALRALTLRFEARTLSAIELPRADWEAAAAAVPAPVRSALAEAAARIRRYHELEVYRSYETVEAGVKLSCRYSPLARVGIYVPGGTARYPSTVLMTAVPAKVAGVREVFMTTPGPSPETLAALVPRDRGRKGEAVADLGYALARARELVAPDGLVVVAGSIFLVGSVRARLLNESIDPIAGSDPMP